MALTFGPEGAIDTLNGRIVVSYGGQLHYADDGALYDPDAGYANTFSNFKLGPIEQQGEYIVRGDYRMPGIVGQRQGGGQLEYRDASGQWRPVGGGLGNYDPRQDSDAQGSNERLQFDWAFANAPAGADIRTMRQMAIDSGWTEPDRSQNEGTFGSFLEAAVPGVLAVLGVGWAANAGMLGAMGGTEAAAASTEAATLAAGDAMAGLIPADTGGWLVGSDGIIGSTGNAIGDQVLNSAGQNAIKSAVTGGDPVQGALQGAAGGLIGASGIGTGAADMVGATGDAATAVTTGVNAAAGAGAMTAINGGSFSDILENSAISGVSQGAGSYVSNALDSGSNAIDRGVGGAVAGGTNAALTGGDVGTGLLTSGLAGAAGGLATDLGASPAVSGVVQGVTGGIVNSALQPDAVVNPPPATTTTPTPAAPDVSSISFGDVIPHFVDVSRSTEWGNRLIQAGRI